MPTYRIQTFTAMAGTIACDAKCPFCVAAMTTRPEDLPPPCNISPRWFKKALAMAEKCQADSFLITGKGEPTLWPSQVTSYLHLMSSLGSGHRGISTIPFWEIQSNVLQIGQLAETGKCAVNGLTPDLLRSWHECGLDLFAISRVDVLPGPNQQIYSKKYPDLERTIEFLHEIGYKTRLCIMMHNGFVDKPEDLDRLIDFCQKNGVSQLTVRPIRKPEVTNSDRTSMYVMEQGVTKEQEESVFRAIDQRGTLIRRLVHGARIYDVGGQNVCLADCLTLEPDNEDIRSLIFLPTGNNSADIQTQWDYPGSNLI